MSSWWRTARAESERTFVARATEHLPALLRFARRLTRNTADAEDLVQETLMRAVEKRSGLSDAAQLKPWLLSIERNTWLNSRRGMRNRLEVLAGGLSAEERPPEATADLERELLDRSLDDALLAALDALPEEWREALWLREVEELSYEEIAAVASCPVGTVRSRLARARAALLARMGGARSHGLQ